MARIIVVTSGKGGVGKTTSSAAIATGLAQKGKKTVVIDFDIGLRNLDLIWVVSAASYTTSLTSFRVMLH